MEREFRNGAGVGDLAALLGVTPTHLTRCCQQCCGRSAIELLQDRRIFEARKMLAETDQPVGQIGAALGFASPAYFTRAFQHRTGQAPSAFRRAI
jgi:AraC family transcriptional activator of pobA